MHFSYLRYFSIFTLYFLLFASSGGLQTLTSGPKPEFKHPLILLGDKDHELGNLPIFHLNSTSQLMYECHLEFKELIPLQELYWHHAHIFVFLQSSTNGIGGIWIQQPRHSITPHFHLSTRIIGVMIVICLYNRNLSKALVGKSLLKVFF